MGHGCEGPPAIMARGRVYGRVVHQERVKYIRIIGMDRFWRDICGHVGWRCDSDPAINAFVDQMRAPGKTEK